MSRAVTRAGGLRTARSARCNMGNGHTVLSPLLEDKKGNKNRLCLFHRMQSSLRMRWTRWAKTETNGTQHQAAIELHGEFLDILDEWRNNVTARYGDALNLTKEEENIRELINKSFPTAAQQARKTAGDSGVASSNKILGKRQREEFPAAQHDDGLPSAMEDIEITARNSVGLNALKELTEKMLEVSAVIGVEDSGDLFRIGGWPQGIVDDESVARFTQFLELALEANR